MIYALEMLKDLWQVIVGAFIGGGAAAALINIGFAKRHEQQRWLRDQKLQASAQFLRAIYGISNEMLNFENGAGDPDKFFEQQVESQRSLVELVSPPSVINAATAIANSIGTWADVDRTTPNDRSLVAFHTFRDRITDYITAVLEDLKTD